MEVTLWRLTLHQTLLKQRRFSLPRERFLFELLRKGQPGKAMLAWQTILPFVDYYKKKIKAQT